jgi:ribose/xylose/arabinose/galactoside ABC-type transport system permease subunit
MKQWKERLNLQNLWGNYSALVIIFVLILFFNFFGVGFQTVENYQMIISKSTVPILVVTGLAFVMVGGGIDFSIGYQISLVAVVISQLSARGVPDWGVILCAMAVGLLCGLLNGILVGYMEIMPFAATIATQVILKGISYVLSNGVMVSNLVGTIRAITRASILQVGVDVWLALLGLLFLWGVLHGTYGGKYLRAVGLNEARAVQAGVQVKRVKCLSYCIASFFYVLAAMVSISRQGYAGSDTGVGMEITAITAAYIGGILTLAEKQNILALVLGALVVTIIENGLSSVGVSSYLQYMITGAILIISMVIHRRKRTI